MEAMKVRKIKRKDEQSSGPQKKRNARTYQACFPKTSKKVYRADHCDDLNKTNSGSREDFLGKLIERTRERTTVTSSNQYAKEAFEENNENKFRIFCHGKGCQRSYHPSCLEPPVEDFHLGVWYCLLCVRKKIESGVHSVSEGMEAIWDCRQLEVSEDGLRGQKQYLVKYKGLAHVHDLWIPEKQVLLEAPSLLRKYKQKNQGCVWKQHWAVPRRLLQKRLLITKDCDGHHCNGRDGDKLNCHAEWLVKWCGLGYEHASWELENASFLSCPESQSLIQDYETRHKKAKRDSKFYKELPQGRAVSSGIEANLDAVEKLNNSWHRSQNAVILYDQERIPNVISTITSFPSDKSRPFLIISTSTLLNLWDDEFLRLAPSTDVVVYSGSKEIRNSIRNLEFYEGGGCIMFQVLVTSPEVVSEDLDSLNCIGWEVIIVDECQRPKMASCFEQIKMITAGKRLLLINSQLKDNVVQYLNVISLLDSHSDSNDSDCFPTNSSDDIGILKKRLAKYVAYESSYESSRFAEYWIPVILSNVQLEQYCFNLLSRSLSLCSPSKTDRVGALRSILISSRKCCDHPYIVDESLQMLLTNGLKESEILDVGIKASGKLQLLDAMLLEIKKRGLKVLVLFQYIGDSGKNLMGNILEDVLHRRFGPDSYERLDGGATVNSSKKQSVLNNFNNERERFVFLLDTRDCLPSIKLSAISTVIIFGSDWSPMNDLRALQKITLDSPFEEIKVFRLYSSFTVEEKILMLSKQEKTLDCNIVNVSPTCSHMLLKWGASYLFSQLEKFHGISTLDAMPEQSHLEDVIQEFVILLHQTDVEMDTSKLSQISKAKQNQRMHRTEIRLFGEQKMQVMDEDPPHMFWTKLLEGKSPVWKYSSSQRNRKRVQYSNDLQKKSEVESIEVAKRRKVVSDGNDHPSQIRGLQEDWEGTSAYGLSPSSKLSASETDKIHATSNPIDLADDTSVAPSINMVELEERIKQCNLQKNVHVLLRPQIEKLCEVLHLSEDAKALAGRFLDYFMNNHLINWELESILQAFQISLCWCAASMSKQKIDHKESLALAKQHLGFTCKKQEADYVNSMLRCLKKMFLYRTGYLNVPNSHKASKLSSYATSYQQNVKAKVEDLLGFQDASDAHVIADSGLYPEFQLAQIDLVKSIKEIEKKFKKKMAKLMERQKEQIKQLKQNYEEEKAQLENKKKTAVTVIRLHIDKDALMRTEKIKNLDIAYDRKFDELKQKMDLDLKNLEAQQVTERSNVSERETSWIESIKSWARVELVMPPVSEANLSKERSSAGVIQSAAKSEVILSKIVPDRVMACNDPIDPGESCKENSKVASVEDGNKTVCSIGGEEQSVYQDSCPREPVSAGEVLEGGVLEEQACNDPIDLGESCKENSKVASVEDGNKTICSIGGEEQAVYQDSCPRELVSAGEVLERGVLEEQACNDPIDPGDLSLQCLDEDQISDESKSNMSNGNPETVSPADASENILSTEALSCEEIPSGAPSGKPNSGFPLKAVESVSFCKGQNNLSSLQGPSSEKSSDSDTLKMIDGEAPLKELGIVISGEGRDNLVPLEAKLSVEIPDGPNSSKVDGQVILRETPVANFNEGQENHVSGEALSSEEILDGAALEKDVGDIHLRTKIVSSGGCLENSVSLETPSSGEIPDGTTLSNLDGEVQSRAADGNSGKDHENFPSVVVPLSEKNCTGTTLSTADGELPLSAHEVVSSSEGQGNVMGANSSSEKRIPCGDTVNMPDREVPTSTSEIATSNDGMNNIVGTNPSTSKEPGGIHDTAAGSVPTEEISLAESGTAHSEVLKGGSTLIENDGTSAVEIDQQDGLLCSIDLEPDLQEWSLVDLSSLQPVPTSDQNGPAPPDLVSSGMQARDVANTEMRNVSRVAETSPSNGSIDVTCNVSILDTPVVELRVQMQQSRFTESISNLSLPDLPSVSVTEHQPTNANQISQAPRQSMRNPIELSNQDVLQPLHPPIYSTSGGHLRQVSEISTVSVPSVSRGLPLQTAPLVSSQIPLPSYHDPLKNEIVRLCQEKVQTIKFHEDTKLQLKLECEKEIEEVVVQIRRKYEAKLQEKETELLHLKKKIDVKFNQALLNEILAGVFRSDFIDNTAPGSAGSQQEPHFNFIQQLLQASSQQMVQEVSTASGLGSTGPASSSTPQLLQPSSQQMVQQPSTCSGIRSSGSATSIQTVPPAVVGTQTMAPYLQVGHPSGFFSGTPARSPNISPILSTGSLRMGSEIRAPVPHLQTFRTLASISPSSLPLQSRGMSTPLAHNLTHRQPSITSQTGRIQHEIAGGLAAPAGMNSHISGANANPLNNLLPGVSSSLAIAVNQERHAPSSIQPNPAQHSGGATDIVCLSDDD